MCGPLLLRKTIGTTDCSDITMPLGRFLEILEQMAWGPSLSAEPIQAFGKHNHLLFFPEGRKHLQVFCSLKPVLSSKYML